MNFTGKVVCSVCNKDYGTPTGPYPPFCGSCPRIGVTRGDGILVIGALGSKHPQQDLEAAILRASVPGGDPGARLVRRPGVGDRVWDESGWQAGFCPVATVVEVVPHVIGGDAVQDPEKPNYWSDGYRIQPDFDVLGTDGKPVMRADQIVPLAEIGTWTRAVEWLTRWPRRIWWRFAL